MNQQWSDSKGVMLLVWDLSGIDHWFFPTLLGLDRPLNWSNAPWYSQWKGFTWNESTTNLEGASFCHAPPPAVRVAILQWWCFGNSYRLIWYLNERNGHCLPNEMNQQQTQKKTRFYLTLRYCPPLPPSQPTHTCGKYMLWTNQYLTLKCCVACMEFGWA